MNKNVQIGTFLDRCKQKEGMFLFGHFMHIRKSTSI